VQPAGDRHGRPPEPPPERQSAGAGHGSPPRRRPDEVALHSGPDAAYPLLRERVRAAPRRLLAHAAAEQPWTGPAPATPAAVVQRIRAAQRWLAGAQAAAADLDAAFAAGLHDATAILRDVGRFDERVGAWFAAVARASGAA
jgi:hypothetical protein